MKITVYTKPSCPACDGTKRYLDKHQLPYEAIDATADETAYAHVVEELGYRQMPVVEIEDPSWDGPDHWSGLRPDLIKDLAGHAGA